MPYDTMDGNRGKTIETIEDRMENPQTNIMVPHTDHRLSVNKINELDELVKGLAQTVKHHDTHLEDIKRTLSQIATDVHEIKNSQGRLSSQPLPNFKGGANTTITSPQNTMGKLLKHLILSPRLK